MRKAIELLVDDGFVIRKQGIGTFVAQRKLHRTIKNHQGISFTEMSILSGQEPSAELISVERIIPNASVARHLHVDENEQVLKLVRLRKNDGEPVMIEESYYPEEEFFLLQENRWVPPMRFSGIHNLYSVSFCKDRRDLLCKCHGGPVSWGGRGSGADSAEG